MKFVFKLILKFFPLILIILAFISLILSSSVGTAFLKSRGSVLCLSCMGLEENENF